MNTLFLTMLLANVALGSGPDATCRVVLNDLQKVPVLDRPFTRYLSLAVTPDADLLLWIRMKGYWVNGLSTERAVTLPEPIFDKEAALQKLLNQERVSRLLRIDIRDYGWNQAAWRAVAAREPFHREPWVNSAVAKLLRDTIGEVEDVKTFHVFAVVRGDWFFRDTAETDRSTSYYDLLYSRQRFGKVNNDKEAVNLKAATQTVKKWKQVEVKYEPGRPWEGDGKHYNKAFTYKKWVEVDDVVAIADAKIKVVQGKNEAVVDFPKDKKDWDRAWGLDKIEDFLKESKIQTANGAVALGIGDDPKRGSFVARSNRLLKFQPCATGVSLESFDVLDPTGERDYVQNAPNLAKGKIVFDAQELLVNLPNGGQAALLVAGNDGKRVEVADPKVAIDTTDAFDRRVRTPGSCVVCHATNYGVISPNNLVSDFFGTKAKNPLIFTDRNLERDFRGFFLDWERKIEPVYQTPYKIMVEQSTAFGKLPTWKGIDVSKAVSYARAWYDKPLSLEQVCIETGMTPEEFNLVTAQSTLAWVALVKRGEKIPRKPWDSDVFPEVMKLWTLKKLPPFDVKGAKP